MTSAGTPPEWTVRGERGAMPLLKFIVWVALRLGRPAARLFLYPICLYFLIFSGRPRLASRRYLARVLGRRPGAADVFRHYHAFASCILDRVFFLNDGLHRFDVQVQGEDVVMDILERGSGCILLGAHFGSFEVARALGRRQPGLRVTLVMYEENARKIRSALNAINPDLAMDVVGLGKPGAMIEVDQRLEEGHFVGILADRSLDGEERARYPFLGAPAAFPSGPFRMAALLKRPVVLMFGAYRGGRRYDVHFERLTDLSEAAPCGVRDDIDKAMSRYVERLEHHCREAPFNWFNFFDFWA